MKIFKKVCFLIILNILLWIYAGKLDGYTSDFARQFCMWAADFEQFDAACIRWMAMRITIWLSVLWKLLWLEQSFMLYLFIRERNYKKMFMKQYGYCLFDVIAYFGMQLLVFSALAIRHDGSIFGVVQGFMQLKLWAVLINEIFGTLNMCMFIYGLYCVTRKVEVSFLIVLVARLALGCMTGGLTQYLYIGLLVNPLGNVCLSIGVMHLAGVGFYDRIQGEAM